MFWGVTLETGKRYSQIVESSYHLSMAALEPLPSAECHQFISVMLEHNKSEFLLCTLEHNNVLQVNLDHCFVEGEEVTYFLAGEGVVHLTGYIITDDIDGEEAEDSDESEDNRVLPLNMLTNRLQQDIDNEDDSEEDDDDWVPKIEGKKKLGQVPESNRNSAKVRGTSDTNNKIEETKSPSKKMKAERKSPMEKSGLNNSKGDVAKRTQLKKEALSKLVPGEESSDEDEDLLSDDSEHDEDDSSDESDDSEDIDSEDLEDEEDDVEEDGIEEQQPTIKKRKLDSNLHKVQSPFGPSGHTISKKSPISTTAGQSNKIENRTSPKKAKESSIPLNQTPSQKASPENANGLGKKPTPGQKTTPGQKANQGQKTTPGNTKSSPMGTPQSADSKKRLSFGGVQVTDVILGSGPPAKPGKMVHVYYRGTLPNSTEFDSCTKGKPFGFRLGKTEVIKGWDVGIQGMKVGGKRTLVIPPAMGYGNKPTGPIPANSILHFEVELKAVS